MGKWNFDDIENSLVSDAEKRIERGYSERDRGQVPVTAQTNERDGGQVPVTAQVNENERDGGQRDGGQVPVTTQSSANVGDRYLSPVTSSVGVKCAETKGVQTYLPLKDYMRLEAIKHQRRRTIAQIAGEAIIDWLDQQEQEGAK